MYGWMAFCSCIFSTQLRSMIDHDPSIRRHCSLQNCWVYLIGPGQKFAKPTKPPGTVAFYCSTAWAMEVDSLYIEADLAWFGIIGWERVARIFLESSFLLTLIGNWITPSYLAEGQEKLLLYLYLLVELFLPFSGFLKIPIILDDRNIRQRHSKKRVGIKKIKIKIKLK